MSHNPFRLSTFISYHIAYIVLLNLCLHLRNLLFSTWIVYSSFVIIQLCYTSLSLGADQTFQLACRFNWLADFCRNTFSINQKVKYCMLIANEQLPSSGPLCLSLRLKLAFRMLLSVQCGNRSTQVMCYYTFIMCHYISSHTVIKTGFCYLN